MSDTPSPKSKSYVARGATDCAMLGELEEQPCWGVVRFSKYDCYLCEGHRAPPDYIEEPTPENREDRMAEIKAQLKAEEEAKAKAIAEWGVPITDEEWLKGGWTAARWNEYQANRWFRPFLSDGIDVVGVGLFFTDLTDVMLSFIHAMIGDGLRCGDGNEKVNRLLEHLGKQATAELFRRGVPWPNDCYALKLAPPWEGVISLTNPRYTDPFGEKLLAMGFHHLSNDELQVLYGAAAVVVDFSGLERGTRQCSMYACHVFEEELKKREMPSTLLMSLWRE